jgi:hypothetical protein
MRMLTPHEYECTRQKLADLQHWYEESRNRPTANEHLKQLSLRSLGRLIKQLKEEMIWYECHTPGCRPERAELASTSNPGGTSSPCTN